VVVQLRELGVVTALRRLSGSCDDSKHEMKTNFLGREHHTLTLTMLSSQVLGASCPCLLLIPLDSISDMDLQVLERGRGDYLPTLPT